MENEQKKSFAEGICLKKIFWIFIFGCIFGCVFEMIIHFMKYDVWVSRRGLIYGPLNPVYGIGVALFTLCLCHLKKPTAIFIGGALIGGGFEWICSFVQEYAFGSISWDYSGHFLNFGGRTSLFYMLCWGVLAIVYVKLVYPFLSKWIEKIPIKIGNIVTIVLLVFIIIDVVISIAACYRQYQREEGNQADNAIEIFLDDHYPDERLDKIFENKRYVDDK